MADKKKCSYRVFSGERGDIGGHPCMKPFKVTRNGKDFCAFHDPEVVKKRRRVQEAKWAEKSAAQDKRWKKECAAYEALDKLLPAANKRISELEAKLAAKWISVEERLPEDQQEVLIVVPSINLHTKAERQDVFHANFWEESKTMASCEEGDFEDGEYTHWQPLPPAPEVQP